VIQTGGMAAVAVTFAAYFLELTGLKLSAAVLAAVTLAVLAGINCLGVRAGSTVQSGLMVLKIVAILGLVAGGAWFVGAGGRGTAAGAAAGPSTATGADPSGVGLLFALGAAMVPVLFAYGGWQTTNFIAEEVRAPRRNLPRALVLGVTGVVLLYLAVNWVLVAVLGPAGLAASTTPASAVMERALGTAGARWIAVGIAVSTLGFLSQSILTAPRVYYAMGRDGLFFRAVGRLDPRHGVPVAAILLQAAMAIVIALSGRYDQILSYVVSMDFLFFGLTATCLFVFRRREGSGGAAPAEPGARVPGHPWTTALFVTACWLVVSATFARYPVNSLIGLGILLAGVPVYLAWRRPGRVTG
jgi:APA family basic amino acid/polyamine antiporter